MNIKRRLLSWLLGDEVHNTIMQGQLAEQRVLELRKENAELGLHQESLFQALKEADNRRLTLKDLELEPNQLAEFRGCSSALRQAIYDAGEHACLTGVNETARQAVFLFRYYLLDLTLHPTRQNEIPSDRTQLDDERERRKQLFAPRL